MTSNADASLPSLPSHNGIRLALLFLFAASGICGLVYESVWAYYLKQFVGHSALAQAIVLVVFIGGMSLGAWAAGRWSQRLREPLIAYAIVEAVVGLIALVFHPLFLVTTRWAYASLIPSMCSAEGACVAQWILASVFILPQSILLGTTFPLMTAGVLRAFPEAPGRSLSALYFANSIGAVVGVLACTFLLIPSLGPPGTIRLAGSINIGVALGTFVIAWSIVRSRAATSPAPPPAPSSARSPAPSSASSSASSMALSPTLTLALTVAAFTGLASFVYEIVWIRMLSLVLGSSVHAFELMLASFILGLALGGLWIRKRIDRIDDVTGFLARVQIAMGVLALATLPVYSGSFDLMAWFFKALAKSDGGYVLFNIVSNGIAILVMLPAAFMAGTTLPLITLGLLRRGNGEQSIGYVYAANSVGSIVGVVIAVAVLLPMAGLQWGLFAGAAVDIALGCVLFTRAATARDKRTLRNHRPALAWSLGGAIAAAGIVTLLPLDPYRLASGVFRNGNPRVERGAVVEFHRDGRTASVDVIRGERSRWIMTNGKTDASITLDENARTTADQATQLLLGALPLAAVPDARSAAVIGFGSGLTTHTLLAAPGIARVDTIEIEPAMIEGARLFRPRNERAYSDPRSRIVIEDAKAFFARAPERYDIVVSEPSNPWVGGVANLFSDEFYARMRTRVSDRGVFVQWIQLYEIDPPLVATIIRALSRHFPNYDVYAVSTADVIVLARPSPEPIVLSPRLFDIPALTPDLKRIGLGHVGDFGSHWVGGAPLFNAWIGAGPVNSDWHPTLAFAAPLARYTQRDASAILAPRNDPVPIAEIVQSRPWTEAEPPTPVPGGDHFRHGLALQGEDIVNFFLATPHRAAKWMTAAQIARLHAVSDLLLECRRLDEAEALWDEVLTLARNTVSSMSGERQKHLWAAFIASPCYSKLAPVYQDWLQLFAKIGARDATAAAEIGTRMLKGGALRSPAQGEFLLPATAASLIAIGRREDAERIIREHWPNHERDAQEWPSMDLLLRMARAR